jgi:uncharacterized membrane protein
LAPAGLGPQQIVFALAFAIYAVVFNRVAWLRGETVWFQLGARNGSLVALGAGFAALSAVGLLAWYAMARPNLAYLVRTFIPGWPLWLLVPAAIVFSMINAALEEALDTTLGPGPIADTAQARSARRVSHVRRLRDQVSFRTYVRNSPARQT